MSFKNSKIFSHQKNKSSKSLVKFSSLKKGTVSFQPTASPAGLPSFLFHLAFLSSVFFFNGGNQLGVFSSCTKKIHEMVGPQRYLEMLTPYGNDPV